MYDNYFPNTDESFIGLPAINLGTSMNLYVNYPGFGLGYTFTGEKLRAGYLTGRWGTYSGRNIVQVLLEFGDEPYGWIYPDEFTIGAKPKEIKLSDLEKLLSGIVSNNQNIVVNNLLAARLITLIEAKGTTVSDDIKNGIKDLQLRVNERDAQLAKNEWLTGRKTAKPTGASAYADDLSKIMGVNIGIIVTLSVTTIILISALVTAIIGVLLYYAFADSGKMSLNDYKASQKYLDVLAKLSPEDKETVEKEMSSALNYGYKIGGNTSLKNIGILAAGVGIFFAAKPIGERLGITSKK